MTASFVIGAFAAVLQVLGALWGRQLLRALPMIIGTDETVPSAGHVPVARPIGQMPPAGVPPPGSAYDRGPAGGRGYVV